MIKGKFTLSINSVGSINVWLAISIEIGIFNDIPEL